jgi:hypothetical protein
MSDRIVRTTYCDDVRLEIGNKQSYMGIYNGEMLVESFPASIPKLCLIIEARTDLSKPFQKLRTVVMQNDVAIFDSEALLDELQHQPKEPPANIDKEDAHIVIGTICAFTPLNLDGPTILKTRVFTESEELKGTSLSIRAANSNT